MFSIGLKRRNKLRRRKKWIVLFLMLGAIIITVLQVTKSSPKEVINMNENIDINELKIDHLVIQVDDKYQEDLIQADEIRSIGLPYLPKKGKGTKGFQASNIWIGEEYFELVRIKRADGGGWIKDWTKRYNEGERGMICLFLDTNSMDALYTKLKNVGMTKPEKLKYKFFFNLLSISPPWVNAYLPYLEGAPFQIGFQQLEDEKTKQAMQKKMKPNSRENKITGIKKIEIYGNYSRKDREFLYGLFTTTGDITKGALTWQLKDQQTISFINDTNYKVKVYVEKQNEQIAGGSTRIENVEIIVEEMSLDSNEFALGIQ